MFWTVEDAERPSPRGNSPDQIPANPRWIARIGARADVLFGCVRRFLATANKTGERGWPPFQQLLIAAAAFLLLAVLAGFTFH